ncbi:MAG: exo-alpha-sialidase [Verrucomicrobiota bacterium]
MPSQESAPRGPVRPLANDYVTLYESPDPKHIFSYSPGLARLDEGQLVAKAGPRLVATVDLGGPAAKELDGVKFQRGDKGRSWQGRVYTSDDGGETWQHRVNFPFMHARPFVTGESVYVLGHAEDLMIMRSDDGGETWSDPVKLTDGQHWHQAPCNVHYANGCVYLVMERRTSFDIKGWHVGELAPVLMRGRLEDDLTRRENWTFASELSFRDVMPGAEDDPRIDFFGVPFFDSPYPRGASTAPGRNSAPIGWLESNVVQFTDPDHLWHDPEGKTFHLWMRAHTGGTGYACIAKVVEQGEEPGTGPMTTLLETAPSGKRILYVPCPGGQMKFHVLYDDETKLYWLLSTQATDSMTRPDRLPDDRYNLPNNQRRRLQLHFSKNMVDWCFAGLVATGPVEKASRHYASMVIDGEDLVILSRSGDERANTPHDGNLITFHRVKNFRKLVY